MCTPTQTWWCFNIIVLSKHLCPKSMDRWACQMLLTWLSKSILTMWIYLFALHFVEIVSITNTTRLAHYFKYIYIYIYIYICRLTLLIVCSVSMFEVYYIGLAEEIKWTSVEKSLNWFCFADILLFSSNVIHVIMI